MRVGGSRGATPARPRKQSQTGEEGTRSPQCRHRANIFEQTDTRDEKKLRSYLFCLKINTYAQLSRDLFAFKMGFGDTVGILPNYLTLTWELELTGYFGLVI